MTLERVPTSANWRDAMTTQPNNASEVANLLALIVAEYEAAERGLTGYAETARHAQISARMETMGKYVDALGSLMPPGQQAMELVVLALEQGGNHATP
jgi:hypothetical protein